MKNRKGSALVFAVLSCIALVPILGLAIDGAHVYMMRNQVSTALNAAVLAATRSLSAGSSEGAQENSATTAGGGIFCANVSGMGGLFSCSPGGAVNTANVTFSYLDDNVTHQRKVIATATANLPLTFMGMMVSSGMTKVTLSATAVRRDVNVVLVLDNSGSMQGAPLTTLQTDASNFVANFAQSQDNMGLITFASAPWVAYPLAPQQSFLAPIQAAIGQMQAPGFSGANTGAALWAAYQQLQSLNQPGALNVIVLFTDGVPSAFAGNVAGLVQATDVNAVGEACTTVTNALIFTDSFQSTDDGLSDYVDNVLTGMNDTPELRVAQGCTGAPITDIGDESGEAMLLTGLPAADVNGNSTNGSSHYPAYQPLTLNFVDPYGQPLGQNISYAAENAFDYAANTIRSDTNLNPVIYVIGLTTPFGATPPDPVLMARVANQPGSSSYNSSQPSGLYVPAPSTSQLQAAFATIATQVLQLSRN